jgi:hypothetical protein
MSEPMVAMVWRLTTMSDAQRQEADAAAARLVTGWTRAWRRLRPARPAAVASCDE